MTKEELDRAKLQEMHRSNLAQEAIGREANLLRTLGMAGSAFKSVVGVAPTMLKGLIDKASNFDINEGFRRSHNDPEWYTKGLDADSYANVSFSIKQGTNIPLDMLKGVSNTTYYALSTTFGVRFTFVPMLGGYTQDSTPNSATTQAIYQLYDKVRSCNTGAVPYTMEDFTKYFVWYDTICTFYAYLTKIYGSLNIRIPENRSVPFRLINLVAGGLETDTDEFLLDLTSNKANLRNKINALADLINSFTMPGIFDYITRHIWLASNLFTDDESIDRAQIITLTPKGWGVYEPVVGTIPSHITLVDIGEYESYNALERDINLVMTEVLKMQMNGTWSIMSSDLLKLASQYGNNVIRMPYLAEDYVTPLLHDANFLQQMRNADICNLQAPGTSWDHRICAYAPYVAETEAVLPFNWYFRKTLTSGDDVSTYPIIGLLSGSGVCGTQPMLLNCYQDHPTPADVYVATRFKIVPDKFVVTSSSGSTSYAMIKACGSEVLTDARIMVIKKTANNTSPISVLVQITKNNDTTDWPSLAAKYAIHQIEWFPTLWVSTASGCYPLGVVENLAAINPVSLEQLHGRAMRSLLGIYAYPTSTSLYSGGVNQRRSFKPKNKGKVSTSGKSSAKDAEASNPKK